MHFRKRKNNKSLQKLHCKLCLRTKTNTLCTDAQEDEIGNYPQGLVLVQRGNDENSVVVGPHIRGSRLRASAAGFEEVDLLLPGTARSKIFIYFSLSLSYILHGSARS